MAEKKLHKNTLLLHVLRVEFNYVETFFTTHKTYGIINKQKEACYFIINLFHGIPAAIEGQLFFMEFNPLIHIWYINVLVLKKWSG